MYRIFINVYIVNLIVPYVYKKVLLSPGKESTHRCRITQSESWHSKHQTSWEELLLSLLFVVVVVVVLVVVVVVVVVHGVVRAVCVEFCVCAHVIVPLIHFPWEIRVTFPKGTWWSSWQSVGLEIQ